MKVSEAIDQLQVGDTVWVKGEVEYITKLGALPLALEFSETTKYFAESDEVMTANVFKEMEKYENRIGELERQIDEISLTEPTKEVKIPECVGKWIDFCKKQKLSLHTAMNWFSDLPEEIETFYEEAYSWLTDENYQEHEEIFARAWLDGFTVETKRWVIKNTDGDTCYLKRFRIGDDCIDGESSGWIGERSWAFTFDEKPKAEAVAVLVDGSVEEV